jgi:hypothetical protein
MQTRTLMMLVVAGLGASTPALCQVHPQDGIDRNLQERAAREHEFHVRLQEDAAPLPRPIVPGETGLKFYLPTPGSEILRREEVRQPAVPPRAAPGKSVVSGEMQLRDSQSRRQMELQTQIENRPEPERQQILQIQQLGFDRETSAQDLSSKIMRDSSRAVGTPR